MFVCSYVTGSGIGTGGQSQKAAAGDEAVSSFDVGKYGKIDEEKSKNVIFFLVRCGNIKSKY